MALQETKITPKEFVIGKVNADSDIGTLLTFKNTSGKFEQLVGILDTSDFDSKKKSIEVGELHSPLDISVDGREEAVNLEFTFNASGENIKRLNDQKDAKEFIIVAGQSFMYKCNGTFKYAINGISKDNTIKGKITINVTSKQIVPEIDLVLFEDKTKELIVAVKDL